MTLEAPIQIDLSQENSWDQVDDSTLTPEEKTLLREHFREESDAIIYLTQGELQRLKDIISVNDIPAQQDFREFITEQSEEGLSLSDIMGEDFEQAQELDMLDGFTRETLFGNEGILSALDISDTAQDHFSLALSLSLLERLASGEIDLEALAEAGLNTNPEDRAGILNTLFGGMVTSLEGLQTLAEERVIMGGPGIEFPRLEISDNGETNSIFMNPEEGKAFFDRILGGSMTPEEIETMLEEANNVEDIPPINLENIRLETTRDISSLEARLEGLNLQGRLRDAEAARVAAEAALRAAGVNTEGPETPLTPERQGLIERFFEALMNFLTGLTGIEFHDVAEGGREDGEDSEERTEPEEVAISPVERGRELFRTRISEGHLDAFSANQILEMFPESGELSTEAQRIIELINSIPDNGESEDSFEEKFENLFGQRTSDSAIKFNLFVEASGERILQDANTPAANMIAILEEYIRYRNDGNRELYTSWFDNDSGTGNTGRE